MNPLLHTDVYKMGHMEQYPEGTTFISSYLHARSDKLYKEMVFFGLQYYLKKYLVPVTHGNVDEFLKIRNSILGNKASEAVEKKLRDLVELGYWPLEVRAIPEGTILPAKNAVAIVHNTHPDFAWTVGFLESLLLKVWNTTSVASLSLKFKRLFTSYAKATGASIDLIPFQVHDFGYRGTSSEETAALSGAAHLTVFKGTDTVPAVKLLHDYYDAPHGTIGFSVPASEHSVMCTGGESGEFEMIERMLDLYPTGLVSIVSDTYNLWRVLSEYAPRLKEKILARDGKVVFRPDSGDPYDILLGTPDRPGVFDTLWNVFGGSYNERGYKILNAKVGVIYGDGMYHDRVLSIVDGMHRDGWATDNLVIGIGGILLQQHNRDDLGFAFKATQAVINGKSVDLQKNPITDPGKKSLKGKIDVIYDMDGTVVTIEGEDRKNSLLFPVFRDGTLLNVTTLEEVRQRIN